MTIPIEVIHSPHHDGSITAGIVSDTHVPDRADRLHPKMMELLRQARVDVILHAGDISMPSVITRLEEIAPIFAVRGNRDFAFHRKLPLMRYLLLGDTPVTLMHGHGGLVRYLVDKIFYFRDGYRLERYLPILLGAWEQAKVIVFGHTHYKEIVWVGDRLVFNPGSASLIHPPDSFPSIGILHIKPGEKVRCETIMMEGWKLANWRWQPNGGSMEQPHDRHEKVV